MYNTQEVGWDWRMTISGFLYKKIFYSHSNNWDLLATFGSPSP